MLVHIRRVREIRRLFGRDVAAELVSAFVISRLDYGNAVFAVLPGSTVAPVQRMLNAAACLVLGLRSRDPVTASLIDLHWPPVTSRIAYKLRYQKDNNTNDVQQHLKSSLFCKHYGTVMEQSALQHFTMFFSISRFYYSALFYRTV